VALTIFRNARVFDGFNEECAEGVDVVVENNLIKEVSHRPVSIHATDTLSLDVGGRTLIPGLIDAHTHAYFCHVDWQRTDAAGEAYRMAYAVRMLGHALQCGFTTVRDVGGGDYGLWRAIEDGLVRAPRFFYAGKMISMTGGHGDTRLPHTSAHQLGYCSCGSANALCVVADGVDECIKAVREEFRRGAHCIKIMASGGVGSPTDPIWMNQFRDDEIRAIVNEAAERRSYVAAHCHPAAAIKRCVELGVRTIEHGTLMDDESASYVAAHGAFVVPTMAISAVLADEGGRLGLGQAGIGKLQHLLGDALAGLQAMHKAGVRVGFGTDLLGDAYKRRGREFIIRREVFAPVDILRQATSCNASLLQMDGKLGCIKPGAYADLLVVDGDPLADIECLARDGRDLSFVMRNGETISNRLH
jgi:imidazolonepropionase-like amidohydrolase